MLQTEIHVEQELFCRIAQDDPTAYRQIFERYCGKLTAFVYRLTKSEDTAAELVQDIFVKLWVNRARLANVENPQAYIYTMASNRTMDHLRKMSAHSSSFQNKKDYYIFKLNCYQQLPLVRQNSLIAELL